MCEGPAALLPEFSTTEQEVGAFVHWFLSPIGWEFPQRCFLLHIQAPHESGFLQTAIGEALRQEAMVPGIRVGTDGGVCLWQLSW